MYLGCDHGTHQKNITPNQPPVRHVTPQTCLTNLHRLDPQVRRQVSPYKNWFKIHVTIFLGNANKPEKTFLRTMCFSCKFQNLYGQSYTTGLKVIFGTCMRPEYLHRLDAFLETKIRALDPLQPRHELTRKAQQRTKKIAPRNPEVTPPSANHHGTTLPKSLIRLCDLGLESRRASAFCQIYVLKSSVF